MLALRLAYALLLLPLLAGCTTQKAQTPSRPFLFYHDSFSFSNQLVWEYRFDDATGKTTTVRRNPPADYSHHCFVVARAARQFLDHAQFAPDQPVTTDAKYRELIEEVIDRSPRRVSQPAERIVIPGFHDLREFSAAKESLLKAECGGAWQSYFQRGHWRIIFPFTDGHQERTARTLLQRLQEQRTPVVHLVRFPQLSINHAVLVYEATESPEEIQFSAYDPNTPQVPVPLVFDKRERRFSFPRNDYFIGGRVDVYEIFRNWLY